ncbi:RDD family protein [Streptomyces mobaraensis NBRC 13819 = DSM 40847]|uniref:RDD domain-containing protein n=1 Tax=Streptomyces mobaraensis (strain ATCC 29032 / DSM 40847 / JCM 4168 / NBRC 13819 / NCIMB 11159 / IPCR 16-22) TaxID=1223523 RepID=M3BDV5_STRM1|nr:RDD family protein [Streptomyces mobaraensis]EME97759.1 RDD domain-containing protein [Streptomyces mobaraensis NBRC 13819 = DSM 40847]QTT74013.1 RDD family protein [Streptomyces mobaraensis NBRC 13819 = DSM 40847]
MSTDQPQDDDPFGKKPPEDLPPYGGAPGGGPPAGGPHGGGGYGPGPGVGPGPGPGHGGPYGAGGPPPHGGPGNPYGDGFGAADPLAGMPPLASRFKRLLARIIDFLIVFVPVSLIYSAFVWDHWDPSQDNTKNTGLSVLVAIVYFLYEGLMLTARGQTVGKMAMGIRVAMLENGAVPRNAPGWIRAAVYCLPWVVPCCGPLFWLINVLWCAWDKPYQQCIHDKAAKTVVVSAVQ